MLIKETNLNVYLASGHIDFRKSINGLSAIVQEVFLENPLSGNLFVFCNKSCDKIKILKWDNNGFWLYYKRLETGKFIWPIKNESIEITQRELNWLLDGLKIEQPLAHKEYNCKNVI
jgi:transposase